MKRLIQAKLFFALLIMLSLTGCGNTEQRQVKKAVVSEFDRLKELNSKTVQSYLASESLFPDASTSQAPPAVIEEVASLFFKNFDYKILKIHAAETTASCRLQITTLDAHALAKDYQREYLTQVIMAAANGQAYTDISLEQRYLLIKDLMEKNAYQTISNSCNINLVKDKRRWKIQRDADLNNQLVGGFITAAANPYLLTPADTVDVYFGALKNMDASQLSVYLGLNALFSESDENSQALANALLKQVHACFNHRVVNSQDNGTTARVDTEITSFSYDAIVSEYNKKLDDYLNTTDALIDGPSGRLTKSNELLLGCINDNDATQVQTISLNLVNDGVSWKLKSSSQLGTALFGEFNTDTAASSLSSAEESSDGSNVSAEAAE